MGDIEDAKAQLDAARNKAKEIVDQKYDQASQTLDTLGTWPTDEPVTNDTSLGNAITGG